MKFEIFNEPQKSKEKLVTLRTVLDSDGCTIVAVKDNGDFLLRGHLLRFQKCGKVLRFRDVDPDLGFALDEYGKIKLEEE